MNKVAVSVSKIFYISTVGNLIRSMGPIISCLRLQEITIFFFLKLEITMLLLLGLIYLISMKIIFFL